MSFSEDIKKFNSNTTKAATEIFRGSALTIFGMVVKLTPVKKGTLRSNWQVGINNAATGEVTDIDRGGNKAIKAIKNDTLSAKLGDKIYLTNNLPYAKEIENGNSKQAPHGMVKVAVASWEHVVNQKARNK